MKKNVIFERLSLPSLIAFTMAAGVASSPSYGASDSGTLGDAVHFIRSCDHNPPLGDSVYGFGSGSFGSYTPTTLTGGEAVIGIFEYPTTDVCFASGSWFEVNGFSEDPGQAWLTSITCNSIEKTGTSAGYSYVSGIAFWSWSSLFGLQAKVGSDVSCTIVHN